MLAHLDAAMPAAQPSLLATPLAGSHLLCVSAVESALSVGDGVVGVTPNPNRRRRSSVNSRRSSLGTSIISPTIRMPLHLDEVASRIDDAAEGTLVDWPFEQEPVERRSNPLLTVEEVRNRYGLRRQGFGPEHDLSSGSSAASKQSKQSPIKQGASPRRNEPKRKVASNAQLVREVREAKKALRTRLREETLRNKLATQVKQWKDRVVETAPTGLLASGASKFHYDITVDPVHLHQEAMRDVLVEESKIAEQLIVLFQQMAREAEEMRHAREAEEAQEVHRHQQSMQTKLPSLAASGRGAMDTLLNPCRPVEPRVPLHLRIEGSRGGTRTAQATVTGHENTSILMGQSIANLDPAVDGRVFLPKLPKATIPQHHTINNPRDVQARHPQIKSPRRSRVVEEIVVESDMNANEGASKRTAPWAIALRNLEAPSTGFESEPREDPRSHQPSFHRAKLREELQQVKYVPSSSSKVDLVVRTVVEANAASQSHAFLAKRRGTVAAAASTSMANLKAVRSRSVVALAAEALQNHGDEAAASDDASVLRADSPDELPEYWPDVHIPSDPNLRAALHERLIEEAQRDCGFACPSNLLCPIACELMSEPILVSNHIVGTFESSSGRNLEPTAGGGVLRASLERNTWENVIDGLHEGTLLSPKLPYPLNELLSRGLDEATLHVRVDTEKLLALVTWRSTAMWMLANHMLDRREAFHVATSLINTMVDRASSTNVQTSGLLGSVGCDSPSGAERRRRYPVDVMALRAAAHDARKKIQDIAALMDQTRSATQKVVQGLHVLGIKRGCYERDLLRLTVRQQQQQQEAAGSLGLIADINTATEKLRACDEESHQQGKLLLDLERRFTSLKALRSTVGEHIDAYHEHVEAFNIFTRSEREHWGPVYKATLSACYTVLTMLLNRELESTADTRALLNKVALCIGDPSSRSMMAQLPSKLLMVERKMKEARLPLQPLLPLNDAAFVIMAPGGQFEDTLPFEPLEVLPYPSLRNEPALVAPAKTSGVATGAAMLKRKSLVPLPPSPRGAGRLHVHSHDDPKPLASPRIVRPIGSDRKIPFWHFVRKGDTTATTEPSHQGAASERVSSMEPRPADDPQSAPSQLGLRGTNSTPSVGRRQEQNARAAAFAVPGRSQLFLGQKPLHASSHQPSRGIAVHRTPGGLGLSRGNLPAPSQFA